MGIRGFILGVMLLALTGWCMIQETFKQTQARYKLAEISRREDAAHKRLETLHAEEQSLRSPAHLTKAIRENKMRLASLSASMPEVNTPAALASSRRPGQILGQQPGQPVHTLAVATMVGGR